MKHSFVLLLFFISSIGFSLPSSSNGETPEGGPIICNFFPGDGQEASFNNCEPPDRPRRGKVRSWTLDPLGVVSSKRGDDGVIYVSCDNGSCSIDRRGSVTVVCDLRSECRTFAGEVKEAQQDINERVIEELEDAQRVMEEIAETIDDATIVIEAIDKFVDEVFNALGETIGLIRNLIFDALGLETDSDEKGEEEN